MQLSSWLADFSSRRDLLSTHTRQSSRRHSKRRAANLETLEAREVLTVSASIVLGELIVTGGASDAIAVRSGIGTPPRVEVFGNNVRLTNLGSPAASSLTAIRVTAGDGNNTIDLSGVSATVFSSSLRITIDAGNGNDTITGSVDIANSILGGDGADTIIGSTRPDTLDGGNGDDSINGSTGNDLLRGGDGRDSIDGALGNDTIQGGDGKDTLIGNSGSDSIDGGADTDSISGGLDADTLSGGSGNDTVFGGDGDDSLLGGANDDSLSGEVGRDTLNGEAGNDTVSGDVGDDSISDTSGTNSLLGGDGNDLITGGTGNDTALGNDGNDSLYGGAGNDLLYGDGNDPLRLGSGADFIKGNGGNDTLDGGGGRDTVNGDAGNDLIRSGDFDSGGTSLITVSDGGNITEGSAGQTTTASFVVTLSRAPTQIISIQFTTVDGSATTASGDYTAVTGTLQFAPGTTSQIINVPVRGDGIAESNENFFVRLSNATNGFVTDSEGQAIIANDDNWAPLGPGSATGGQSENVAPNNEVTGAVHAVLPHPTNANILFAGGVNGGIWRTTNAQSPAPTWTPLTDFQPALSIGGMAFDATNANTIVAGIGRHSSFGFDGGDLPGMLRSSDLGNTWTLITHPLLVGKNSSSVAVRGNVLLFGADFNFGTGVGLFRSADGGSSWVRVSGTNGLALGGIADIVGDPTNPNRFYASVLGAGVFRSDDQGATWINISINDAGAGGLNSFMSDPANNNAEMAVSGNGRLFVAAMINGQMNYIGYTDNQGLTWTSMDLPQTQESNGEIEGLQPRVQPGGQGIIHFSIAADPTNPNLVYVGGDRQDTPFPNFLGANNFSGRLFRGDTTVTATGAVPSPQWAHLTHRNDIAAIPGGGTASNSSPHADSRDMAIDAAGNLIEGDDGGIYRRTSPRTNTGDWFSISANMQITEQHDFDFDPVSNIAISGNQDTGTTEQVTSNSRVWRSVSTADGGDIAIDTLGVPGQSIRYSSFQNLGAFRGRVVDANNVVQQTFFPALTVSGSGAALVPRFVTPVITNRVAGDRLLIGGGNSLYESLNRGTGITETGVGIVANNGNTVIYGGRVGGVANPELIITAEGNQIFRRTAAGTTFATLAFPGSGIVSLASDPRNSNTVFAVDANNRVWQSNDLATTWASITGNLNDADLRDVEFVVGQSAQPDALVVGGRLGVYRMLLSAPGAWSELGASFLPNAPVNEIRHNTITDTLYVGTMGRGAWSFTSVSFGEQLSTLVAGIGGLINTQAVGDTLLGSTGRDTVIGADGADLIDGGLDDDSLLGGGGDDTLVTGGGNDFTDAGPGEDTVSGSAGNNTLGGGADSDTLVLDAFASGTNTATGTVSTDGADKVLVIGNEFDNVFSISQVGSRLKITTARASITLADSVRAVTIAGGAGNDTINLTDIQRVLPVAITFDLGDGNDTFNGANARIGRVPLQILGGTGNDTLFGSSGTDFFDGGEGNDSLVSNDGADTIRGGAGDDTIRSGLGDDSVQGDDGADTVDGEDGNDTVLGGTGNDVLTGSFGNDLVLGENGNDGLFGGTGNDRLEGGTGADYLRGHSGDDLLLGGDGNDTIRGDAGNETINGGNGDDDIDVGVGDNLATGGDGNDTLIGNTGNDTMLGEDGNDSMIGAAGVDVLLGGDGNDTIAGNGSNDIIQGGSGTNDLSANALSEIDELFVLNPALLLLLNPV